MNEGFTRRSWRRPTITFTLVIMWFLSMASSMAWGWQNTKHPAFRISRSNSQISPTYHRHISTSSVDNHIHCKQSALASTVSATSTTTTSDDDKLPKEIIPILLSVLALILSEGIAVSTLPLHLQSLGATPALIGLSTSAFSIAQMVCCPLMVSLSTKMGRRQTLRLCLLGAALSSMVIASASTIPLLIVARFLAGVFAASIPVAQAGVTDIVPSHQTAMALSQVSAASQTGLVIGPIASAFIQGLLVSMGVPSKYLVRGVFAASAMFALVALALGGAGVDDPTSETFEQEGVPTTTNSNTAVTSTRNETSASPHQPEYVQPSLRLIALLAGWALTLSASTYSMFSSKFLDYGQPQLSAAMSLGAAATILTQILIVPRLVQRVGVHLSDTVGLWAVSMGLVGTSLLRAQPLHTIFYLLIRVGTGIVDTSTATLVARYSNGRDERGRNLGMIQSTRAGARIFTPVLSASLFARSCEHQFPMPGSLPYLVNAVLSFSLTPLPLVLKRIGESKRKAEATATTSS
jgi:MFS family permease